MKNKKLPVILAVLAVVVICAAACGLILLFGVLNGKDKSENSDDNDSESTADTEENSTDGSDTGSSGSGTTYNCLFNSGDSLESFGGYGFSLVVSDQEDVEWGELRQDNGVRSISFDDFKNSVNKDRVYFSINKKDGSYIENMNTYLQACDEDNKTVLSSFLEDKSTNPIVSDFGEGKSLSATTELPFFDIEQKGNYRIDGLVYYQGQWKLVARIANLEFE